MFRATVRAIVSIRIQQPTSALLIGQLTRGSVPSNKRLGFRDWIRYPERHESSEPLAIRVCRIHLTRTLSETLFFMMRSAWGFLPKLALIGASLGGTLLEAGETPVGQLNQIPFFHRKVLVQHRCRKPRRLYLHRESAALAQTSQKQFATVNHLLRGDHLVHGWRRRRGLSRPQFQFRLGNRNDNRRCRDSI